MAPVAASPYSLPVPTPPVSATKDKAAARKRFEAVYSVVRDDLLADFRKCNMPEEAIEYYRRVRTPPPILFLWSDDSNHPTEYGLQCTRWKAQSRTERRRLGRYS
jgi:hypothetical protein